VLTQFNTLSGERTLTSAELLETSGAVHDRAVQQLNAIAEDFESSGDSYLDSAAFEQLSAQCQRVLCKEGDLHIGAVPQITRWVYICYLFIITSIVLQCGRNHCVPSALSHLFTILYWPACLHFLFCTHIHTIVYRALLPRLGLRPGWSDTLQSLATKGVPTYLFSSGYGDVVTQVLLQGMSSAASTSAASAAGARYDVYCLSCLLCYVSLCLCFLNWCVRVDIFKFLAIDN